PHSSLSFERAGIGFSPHAYSLKCSHRNLHLFASFDARCHLRALAIVNGKTVDVARVQRQGSDIKEPAEDIGNAAGDVVEFVLDFAGLKILLIQHALALRVIEANLGIAFARTLFAVFGNSQRTKCPGSKERLEAVMHFVQGIHKPGGVSGQGDALLGARLIHPDYCHSCGKEVPFHAEHVTLAVREAVCRGRAHDLSAAGPDGRSSWAGALGQEQARSKQYEVGCEETAHACLVIGCVQLPSHGGTVNLSASTISPPTPTS